MIALKQDEGLIQGLAIAKEAPKISHLFFADDSIIFCRAHKEEARHLMQVLHEYQRASGQQINIGKSEMMFSSKVSNTIKEEIQAIVPIPITNNIAKYLGMPTQVGRSKKQLFNFIMDKIWGKVKGWKENKLSFAGRGVLIRSVIQAIPTYIMSCFSIPQGICEQIESAICRYWWGGTDTSKKIHWKAKHVLFKAKREGGLGFRNIR
ncbi:putative ribonuclease H protein, partial [Trifolium medium]|nr:putative ribonuclease H protein [Trifolium medium]